MPRLSRAVLLAALVALVGCAPRPGGDARAVGAGGPDEFLILPTRPLELPPDLSALPPPVPGGRNRVDQQPASDAIAALSGSPVAGAGGGSALVARTGPVDPDIRARLALEDALYRRENRGRLLERLFTVNREELVYEDEVLNAEAEFRRLRALGLQVPPAPPPTPQAQ